MGGLLRGPPARQQHGPVRGHLEDLPDDVPLRGRGVEPALAGGAQLAEPTSLRLAAAVTALSCRERTLWSRCASCGLAWQLTQLWFPELLVPAPMKSSCGHVLSKK